MASVDSDLPHWNTLATEKWPTLLVGNGVSINLWSRFVYSSLYVQARLTTEAQELFDRLETTNFETVLEAVHHARLVADALQASTSDIDDIYGAIRDSLFRAVNGSHLPWDRLSTATGKRLAAYINERSKVFTTNCDLIPYWAHLQNKSKVNIVDFFWGKGNTFDPNKVGVWSGYTPLYYLHGALHLWQDEDGNNGKWTHEEKGGLIEVPESYLVTDPKRPLFVSEATSRAKLRTIRRSPYLSHCLRALFDDNKNTVIIGHSLGAQDQHIVDALKDGRKRKFAVAIHPNGDSSWIIAEKGRISGALSPHDVRFFDSKTHPLGEPGLNIG